MKGISLETFEYDALRNAANNLKVAYNLGCDCLGGVDIAIFIRALEARCDELDKTGAVDHTD